MLRINRGSFRRYNACSPRAPFQPPDFKIGVDPSGVANWNPRQHPVLASERPGPAVYNLDIERREATMALSIDGRYRLLLVAFERQGQLQLGYGEAIATTAPLRPSSAKAEAMKLPTGGQVSFTFVRGVVTAAELTTVLAAIRGRTISTCGLEIACGPAAEREPVIIPSMYVSDPNLPATLSPDKRFTWVLDELWDASEGAFDALWATRDFFTIGTWLAERTGISFQYCSDRIGNFLVFHRLSSFFLDAKDNGHGIQWIRALHEGARPDLTWNDLVNGTSRVVGRLRGRRRQTRQGASTTSHSDIRGLRRRAGVAPHDSGSSGVSAV